MSIRDAGSDNVELVILPPSRDLGDGFTVRRALPSAHRRMVGPFIFFDEFGRSEERRVGKECSSPCRSRWSPYH